MSKLEARLRNLPPKVGMPLQKLLAAGQLDEKVVETVLDAGQLAGDTSKLVAFTAGMVYLQSRAVPVHDVIEMAKKQGRRVNLAWSPNRWKEEHDRLSRAEALTRLAQQNVTYDVAKFSAHLPSRFAGYLIRNSRRLGMEGLRQRHCIANYHEQLLAGECAIASVFVDKKRWTVQLAATGNEKAPVRIVQVKTRYNGHPSKDVMERIHRVLKIKKLKEAETYATQEAEGQRFYPENLRRILPVLRDHAVQRVTVSFDGSGDSGSIDRATYEPAIDGRGITVAIRKMRREFVQGAWRYAQALEHVSLDDAIDEVAGDWLNETNVDWFNNHGGFGDLVIDVEAGTVALEVSVRFTETNTEYSTTKNIESGEEVDA